MMEWKKFRDELPEDGKHVWVSNFTEVWMIDKDNDTTPWVDWFKHCHNDQFLPWKVWKYVDVPEIPNKPENNDHLCKVGNYECYKYNDKLVLKFNYKNPDNGQFCSMIVYDCPFCGYSIPKEKDYINQRCC